MDRETLIQKTSDLFLATGQAHHQAFIKQDGFDPEWPMWYANFMSETLSLTLDAKFSMSELIYILIILHDDHTDKAPGVFWPEYYATVLVDQYLTVSDDESFRQLRHLRP